MHAICRCGCGDPRGTDVHRIVGALALDDVDAALDAGLLATSGCAGCSPGCTQSLILARDAKRFALAARERFRAREARLARRQQERLERRVGIAGPTSVQPLPPAAAAALQRALGKAAGRLQE